MFLDPEWTAAHSLQLYTDASGSLGFGAYFNGAWFRGDWQPHQRLPLRSIQWQELFAIVAAASTWGHLWAVHIGAATPAVRAGLPTETIQKIGRWRSSAYQTYTCHPLNHPSDTRTMAAQ